ncbi:hypothetical protein C1H46_026858 [Malus baccata]|uniref:Uncharacterized protein n=1 Tax=Malus baccata TaxID=106549 RepID=A0A540LMK1_MALBA|nr:hypothetical protein C1H46_026858 [Malus baccata]
MGVTKEGPRRRDIGMGWLGRRGRRQIRGGNGEASPCKAGSRVHTVAVEAIEALPGHLKAAALVPDLTPFPVKRFMATLTPPIEGYLDRVKEAARKSSAKEFGS